MRFPNVVLCASGAQLELDVDMTHKQTDTASKIAHFCDSHGALTDPLEEVLIFIGSLGMLVTH